MTTHPTEATTLTNGQWLKIKNAPRGYQHSLFQVHTLADYAAKIGRTVEEQQAHERSHGRTDSPLAWLYREPAILALGYKRPVASVQVEIGEEVEIEGVHYNVFLDLNYQLKLVEVQ